MARLYTRIKEETHAIVESFKNAIWPYLVLYDQDKQILAAGHYKQGIDLIAEITDLTFQNGYAGYVRVGKKKFEKIQAEIRQTGECSLTAILN